MHGTKVHCSPSPVEDSLCCRVRPTLRVEKRAEHMTPDETTSAEIVCLVDDDDAVLTSIGRLLVSDGLGAHTFNDPESFLAHVKTHSVPLVILDIWMEKMTGLEVQAKLAKLSPRTRVIIMTGRKDPGAKQTAMEFGATAFFTKPFDDDEFLGAVHRALSPNVQQ
jgi:FixJ family two-component response regulator